MISVENHLLTIPKLPLKGLALAQMTSAKGEKEDSEYEKLYSTKSKLRENLHVGSNYIGIIISVTLPWEGGNTLGPCNTHFALPGRDFDI